MAMDYWRGMPDYESQKERVESEIEAAARSGETSVMVFSLNIRNRAVVMGLINDGYDLDFSTDGSLFMIRW